MASKMPEPTPDELREMFEDDLRDEGLDANGEPLETKQTSRYRRRGGEPDEH